MYNIEDRNYYSDRRVQSRDEDPWYVSFNETTMTAMVFVEQDEDGIDVERPVKCRYEVCDTCNGKGSHVNPSIDAHGLSREDFDDDPDFREEYFSGMYDVQCYECRGRRVVPVPINEDDINLCH